MEQTAHTQDLKAAYEKALARWESRVDVRKRCQEDVPLAEKTLARARGALLEAEHALKAAFAAETQASQDTDMALAAYEKSKA
jgi:phage baseplate assembly protein W